MLDKQPEVQQGLCHARTSECPVRHGAASRRSWHALAMPRSSSSPTRSRPRAGSTALHWLVCAILVVLSASDAIVATSSVQPLIVRRLLSLTSHPTGAASATLRMNVLVRDTDVLAWFDRLVVHLPGSAWAGSILVKGCLDATPQLNSAPVSCSTISVSGSNATAISLDGRELAAVRPLGRVPLSVHAVLSVDQALDDGSINHLATTEGEPADSNVVVGPMRGPVPQHRGSNVLLFRPGATLAELAADLDDVRASGGDTVRTAFPWPLLQPARGDLAPIAETIVDGFLALAKERGLRVIAILGSTPCWASSAPLSVKGDCSDLAAGWARYPPNDLADLDAITSTVAATWGSRLAGLEVWNEPNSDQFFVGTPAQYVDIVKTVYGAVKRVRPALQVAVGSLALADIDWLRQLYAAGLKGHFDALSVHPYNVRFDTFTGTGNPMTPWPDATYNKESFAIGVPWLHWEMEHHADGRKPIWITEFGFSDCHQASALCVTDADQASYLAQSYQLAARLPYVQVVVAYNAHDVSDADTWKTRFGLTAFNRSRKPAFYAVTRILECLASERC